MKNLVLATAGARSLHRQWMGDPAARSYDVWLNCYEPAALEAFRGDPVRLFDARGTMKWPGMARTLEAAGPEVERYDAVWFPDDDVAIDPAGIEALFSHVHALGLALAQPALSDASYFSAALTLRCPGFTVRFTNFVEVMAPVFSRDALARCRATFPRSQSGWGLDWVWPRILGDPADRVGVVDAVEMTHTRPVAQGAWYRALTVKPSDEAGALATEHGVPLPFEFRQYGGVPAEAGQDRGAYLPAGPGFLWRLLAGTPPSQRWKGPFLRRQWRSVRAGRRARPKTERR